MLGHVISRVWVVTLLCLSSLCLPSRATAVQMPDPDLLMSETGLMLLVIDDVPGTMVKAKKFFDSVYKEHREKGVLGPLQTPMTQYIFQQAQGDQPTHWLIKAVDSIATEGTELEKVWRPIAEKLAKDPTRVTPEEEDEVIAAFARLFKGKMFIGEEDYKPYRTTIFGFEYDPQVFDWMKELRLVAERQRERYGYENQSTVISGVEVVHLPNEGWFVFSVNNVVYGVVDRELDKMKVYIDRILHLREGQEPKWSAFRGSRRFQRVLSEANNASQRKSDAFLFFDLANYNNRAFTFSSLLRQPEVRDMSDAIDPERYDIVSCLSVAFTFSQNSDELFHRYCFPLKVPYVDRIQFLRDNFGPLDLRTIGPIPPTARSFSWFSPIQNGKVPNRLPDVLPRSRPWSRSIFFSNPNPKAWRRLPPDVFSVLEHLVGVHEGNDGLGYCILNVRHNDVNYYFPTVVLPIEIAVSPALLIEKLKLAIDMNQLSPEILFQEYHTGIVDFPLPIQDYSSLPDHRLIEFSPEIQATSSEANAGSFRILAKRTIGTCEVSYVGNRRVNLVFAETNNQVFVIPNRNEFATSKMIEAITSSEQHFSQLPAEVLAQVRPSDRVVQCLLDSEPGFRTFALEGGLAHVANGTFTVSGDEIRYADESLSEDASCLTCVFRVYVDAVSIWSDTIERQLKLDRHFKAVDWFRLLLFREDFMIQIGSMKLPRE